MNLISNLRSKPHTGNEAKIGLKNGIKSSISPNLQIVLGRDYVTKRGNLCGRHKPLGRWREEDDLDD